MSIKTVFNLSTNSRKYLDDYFVKRTTGFWEKKLPVGKKYSYIVHDPFEVLGFDTGYEKLYLVGDNWIDHPEKPIAIVIGCNDWKFGFIADYLFEYRVAFGSRKMVNYNMVRVISQLSIKPSISVIWGYTESKWLNLFLQYKKIPVWRCEDGFIRSADLGANGATPYSLVFDKNGLYYNPTQPSDIISMLNTFDLTPNDIENGKNLLNLYIKNNISKYNPSISSQDKKLKSKKRVLVIGQVDNDASLKFGNINDWSMEAMIKLANFENPKCEIIYRPHPEVYQGLQKTKLSNDNVSLLCELQSPDISIADALDMADHIYTITSLTGFEALLKGKKVTVLGKPFYGGWGLTDDRVSYTESERQRQLSVIDLFVISYVYYPKYLVPLEGNFAQATSTIYRILSDKFVLTNIVANDVKLDETDKVISLASTHSWVALLDRAQIDKDESLIIQILSNTYLGKYFPQSDLSQQLVAYFLLGKALDEKSRNYILTILRKYLTIENYNIVLLEVNSFTHYEKLLKHWIWLFNNSNKEDAALDILDTYIRKRFLNDEISEKSILSNTLDSEFINESEGEEEESILIKAEKVKDFSALLYDKLEMQIENRKLSDAFTTVFKLLLLNYNSRTLLPRICTLLKLSNNYNELLIISQIYQGLDLYHANRSAITYEMQARLQLGFDDINEMVVFLSRLVNLKPELIIAARTILDHHFLNKISLKNDFYLDLLNSQLFFDNDLSSRKVQSYIAIEAFRKAQRTASYLLDGTINSQVQYSQALSYNGALQEAINLMESSIRISFVKMNVQELLRLNVLASRYDRSLKLLSEAENRGLELGDMHLRKVYFGNRMIGEALKTFTQINIVKLVKKYYKKKCFDTSNHDLDFNILLLLSIFGPGDEIRFASIYPLISKFFTDKDIYITCSPRLKTLFQRSFKDISFVEVHRARSVEQLNLKDYDKVPGSDICSLINNDAIDVIEKTEKLGFVTDLLHVFLPSYDKFPGVRYLKEDESLKFDLQARLDSFGKSKILVGISWRSSLTTTSRNEHYLSIENLAPIFSLPDVQFVNLQYDECLAEVAWVNNTFPGKLINFEDIDQYNDFESVAALMSCLDLVISPATTVVELSGALGVKSWLFSNSSEIDWRKIDEHGTDVWHNSIEIVDVEEKGNKELLVEELSKKLLAFSQDNSKLKDEMIS
ncbi:capsular polysaccharide export protein, LipB/KpsS family [Acinetobacter terrestris]|uniref:capsular polysaccharide export protein, LipB/KpsS family n=1 Tax=Acinetobacter terrestris TaxID=2529843 RepID=UPI00103FCB94|nr:hypothetical protein [Acinetobacter terrestris]TCB52219.1 hypothetical protein E0H84_13275 [Acinetobacter terrestris]